MIFVSAIREGVRIRPSGRKLRPRPTSFCGQRARQSGEDDRLKRPLPSTLSPTSKESVQRDEASSSRSLSDLATFSVFDTDTRRTPRSASATAIVLLPGCFVPGGFDTLGTLLHTAPSRVQKRRDQGSLEHVNGAPSSTTTRTAPWTSVVGAMAVLGSGKEAAARAR